MKFQEILFKEEWTFSSPLSFGYGRVKPVFAAKPTKLKILLVFTKNGRQNNLIR